MENKRLGEHPTLRAGVLYGTWVMLFFVLFFRSWVSEDAYITFRVIDNFVQGYGLRWNTFERVQVYTHPLWLLLHLPFAFLWDNLFHLNMALSLLCSVIAVAVVLFTFHASLEMVLVAFMLPLFLSKCFLDYAGSGLETSLSYLLFALLGYVVVRWQERRYFLLAFALASSLLLLNRLDHFLLIAPLWIYFLGQNPRAMISVKGIASIFIGMLPLMAWMGFALFYYGFVFPNTKYAKLDTGLPLSDYLWQGMQYAFIWLTQDTVSVAVVTASLLIAACRPGFYRAIAIGIALNIVYVITIGGDYMMGRFFAVIFFIAAWLLLAALPQRLRPDIAFAAALALLTAATASYFVRDIRRNCESCIPILGKVIDAQQIFGGNALFRQLWPPQLRTEGQYKFARDGKKLAEENPPPVKPLRYVGMMGYMAGPRAIIIDELALADPVLSRLPAIEGRGFFVGHYRRGIPKGYMDAVQYGSLDNMEPELAQYYAKIKLITQGELWDRERLITILHFNLGDYDHFKSDFLQKPL